MNTIKNYLIVSGMWKIAPCYLLGQLSVFKMQIGNLLMLIYGITIKRSQVSPLKEELWYQRGRIVLKFNFDIYFGDKDLWWTI